MHFLTNCYFQMCTKLSTLAKLTYLPMQNDITKMIHSLAWFKAQEEKRLNYFLTASKLVALCVYFFCYVYKPAVMAQRPQKRKIALLPPRCNHSSRMTLFITEGRPKEGHLCSICEDLKLFILETMLSSFSLYYKLNRHISNIIYQILQETLASTIKNNIEKYSSATLPSWKKVLKKFDFWKRGITIKIKF